MKVFIIILAVFAALTAFILSFEISLNIVYNESFEYKIKLGPIRLDKRLFKTGGRKKKKKSQKSDKKGASDATAKEKMPISEAIELAAKLIGKFSKKFFGRVKIKCARAVVCVGGVDPAKTAVNYGIVSQAVSYLVEVLKRNTKFKPQKNADMRVFCDFNRERTCADINITVSVSLFNVLDSAAAVGIEYIKHILKSKT